MLMNAAFCWWNDYFCPEEVDFNSETLEQKVIRTIYSVVPSHSDFSRLAVVSSDKTSLRGFTALLLTHPPPPAMLNTHKPWKYLKHRRGNACKSQKLPQLF